MKKKKLDKNEAAKSCGNLDNREWLEWLKKVMLNRPKNNPYLDSKRGFEVGRLCLEVEKELFSWRRSDPDTFWIDVQLCVKYKLSDEDIIFVLKMQPGIDEYKINASAKNAYAEMMRGMSKLYNFEWHKDEERRKKEEELEEFKSFGKLDNKKSLDK